MKVIFDLDGVLVDNLKFEKKVLEYFYRRIMKKYKVDRWVAEQLFWNIGKDFEGKKEWHDWRIYNDKLDLGNTWRKAHLTNLKYLKLIPFSKQLLSKLKKEGHVLILASDAIKPVIDWKLRHFNLKKYFSLIFSQDDTGCLKNNPEYFKKIISRVKGKPSEFIVIDNRLDKGIKSAKKLGMITIYIRKKEHSHLFFKEDKKIKPDFYVRNLREVYKRIKKLGDVSKKF